MINSLCQKGEVLNCFKLMGKYVNINDRDSLQLAKYYVRDYGWDSKLINLLIYSEGDEEDIVFSINQYKNRVHSIESMYFYRINPALKMK
jgi:hypothetical protein